MPVSTRSPRNQARRKMIGVGHRTWLQRWNGEREWEKRKAKKAVALKLRIERSRKRREAIEKADAVKKRGLL